MHVRYSLIFGWHFGETTVFIPYMDSVTFPRQIQDITEIRLFEVHGPIPPCYRVKILGWVHHETLTVLFLHVFRFFHTADTARES